MRVEQLERELDEARAEVAMLRVSQMSMLENLQARDREVKELTAQLQAAILAKKDKVEAGRRPSFGGVGSPWSRG